MQQRPRRSAAIALVGSLAMHLALLGFWVLRAPSDIHATRSESRVDLEIVERAHPKAVLPAPAHVPAAPPTAPAVRPAQPSVSREHGPRSTPAAPAVSAVPLPPKISASPLSSQVLAPGDTGIPVAESPLVPKAPDLGVAGTAAARKVAEAQFGMERLPPAPLDRSIQAPSQDPDVNRRVASLIDGTRGRRMVERGMIDPYFSELSKSLVANWQLPKSVEHPMAGSVLKGLGENLVEGLSGWQQAAEQWGHSGTMAIGRRDPDGRDEAEAAGDAMAMMDVFSHKGALLVRLTQSRAGHLLNVELVAHSGNLEVDAAVMQGLRSGETVMPVPPAEGLGIKDPIRSLWAFQLSIKVCPPAPILSGSFDVAAPFDRKMGSGVNVCVPLDRTISKNVELLEVD